MSALTVRNLVLLLATIGGVWIASLIEAPLDPARPYLVLLGLLVVLKLNLEFVLGLTMHVPQFLATPPERSKRRQALIASWLLAPLMIWFALAW